MKPKLSPQQKEEKRQRDALEMIHARIESAFNFKQIRTWNDVYKHMGYTQEYILSHYMDKEHNSKELTFAELKDYLAEQKRQLEERLKKNEDISNRDNSELLRQSNENSRGNNNLQDSIRTEIVQDISSGAVRIADAEGNRGIRPEPTVQGASVDDSSMTVMEVAKEVFNADNDYGLHPSPNEEAKHFWFQKKAIKELWDKVVVQKKRGVLLLAGTGIGKTYMTGGFVRRLEDITFWEMENGMRRTWSHIPYLYVTRSSVVQQTQRVLESKYNLTVEQMEVVNIEQLRSSAGRLWVKEEKRIVNGEDEYFWLWKKNINPCVILWDECQALKNSDSTQHKIATAYNDLPTNETYQVFISATPFTRVCEAKCFAVSTRKSIEHLGFPPGTHLSNETWPAYAAVIANPSKPEEYNESAVERLMKDLDEYVVRVKGAKPQFEASNSIDMISFETKEERDFYLGAWKRYLKEKEKLDAIAMAEGRKPGGVALLVEFLKFRMAAELARKHRLAKEMYNIVTQKKKAAVCALNFKGSIIGIVKILVEDYNIPRSQISLIWGGGQTALTSKQATKAKIRSMKDKFEAMGMSEEEMIETMGLDEVEDKILEDLPPEYRLGPQSPEERQVEIDKFQSGRSQFCLFTFRAGGVGLSLHHSDEQTKDWDRSVEGFEEWFEKIQKLPEKDRPAPGKCRRKDSGYVVEEDIKFIPVRPREVLVAPTYSAIELVQGLGRGPRLTSLSETVQRLIFYRDTIEKDVAYIVSKKLRCLSKVVRMREKWEDVAMGGSKTKDETVQKHIEAVPEEDSGVDSNEAFEADTGEE